MKLSSLSAGTLEKLKKYKLDQIIHKHEGPWDYEPFIEYFDIEFITIEEFDVLLPVERKHHP